MATVTELLDRASKITGLSATGTERQIALDSLQNAYRRVLMDSECDPQVVSYTFAASSDSYNLNTILGEDPVRLTHVSLTSGGGKTPIRQVSAQELQDYRALAQTIGTPMIYATIGFDRIALYPNPAVGDVATVWFLRDTPILVESGAASGEETTPSKVPVAFHWDVLLSGTVIELLDKDQRINDGAFWMSRYSEHLSRLTQHIGQMGGEANRAYLELSGRGRVFRDERLR